MTKYILVSFFCLIMSKSAFAQEPAMKNGVPCYTKQWVDSVNTVTAARLNEGVPNLVEWYYYDGQTQKVPGPSSIINVVKVKLEATCPQEVKKTKSEK